MGVNENKRRELTRDLLLRIIDEYPIVNDIKALLKYNPTYLNTRYEEQHYILIRTDTSRKEPIHAFWEKIRNNGSIEYKFIGHSLEDIANENKPALFI